MKTDVPSWMVSDIPTGRIDHVVAREAYDFVAIHAKQERIAGMLLSLIRELGLPMGYTMPVVGYHSLRDMDEKHLACGRLMDIDCLVAEWLNALDFGSG